MPHKFKINPAHDSRDDTLCMSMRRIWNLADKAGLDAVKHKAKKSFDFAKLWPGPVTGVAQGPKAAAAKEFMLGCEEIALCGNSTEERCASLA